MKWVAEEYHRFIEWIGDGTGMSDTILHIHAGMAVLMVARLVTRRSFGTFIPFVAVVFAEGANEVLDRINFGSWRWDDTLNDIGNTLFWPLIISLGVRLRPLLLRPVEVAVPVDESVQPLGEHDARRIPGQGVER